MCGCFHHLFQWGRGERSYTTIYVNTLYMYVLFGFLSIYTVTKHVSIFRCKPLDSKKIYLLEINLNHCYIIYMYNIFIHRFHPTKKSAQQKLMHHSTPVSHQPSSPCVRYKAWLFLSTAPSDAAPYAFIRLQVIQPQKYLAQWWALFVLT